MRVVALYIDQWDRLAALELAEQFDQELIAFFLGQDAIDVHTAVLRRVDLGIHKLPLGALAGDRHQPCQTSIELRHSGSEFVF